MYAVVRIGGRQYPAEIGKTLVVEKLPYDEGEEIVFDEVLYLNDESTITVGAPTISGASVTAEVVDQFKGKKIIVYKYKPKNRYRRKQGHRQQYTRLLVKDISTGKSQAATKVNEESEEAETAEAEA